jgi:hypothetical protein
MTECPRREQLNPARSIRALRGLPDTVHFRAAFKVYLRKALGFLIETTTGMASPWGPGRSLKSVGFANACL